MTRIIAAAALAAFIATPAAAQTTKTGADNAALKSHASDPSKSKTKAKKRVAAAPVAAAPATVAQVWWPFFATYSPPYSSNPEYDVYVRGEYVGSDPDPRIRATLRDEWKRSFNLR